MNFKAILEAGARIMRTYKRIGMSPLSFAISTLLDSDPRPDPVCNSTELLRYKLQLPIGVDPRHYLNLSMLDKALGDPKEASRIVGVDGLPLAS